jgi:hypothetical protein
MPHNISEEQIRNLALGKLTTHESIQVQRHIFNCPDCLRKLIEITFLQEMNGQGPKPLVVPSTRTPLCFVHDTADGMIYSKVERRGRKWMGRHWGDQLDGMRVCATVREANEYVVTSFSEMFPEHRCTERCQILSPATADTKQKSTGTFGAPLH